MNEEFMRQEGKLAVAKQNAERLRLRLLGIARTIRSCLDPTETDPAKFKSDIVLAEAFELNKLRADYLAFIAEISEINQYLGRS